MLNLTKSDVAANPFPHAVKRGILPPEMFAGLKADFPRADVFAEQHAESGGIGSRVGKDTGFDIYRGDDSYDRLVAQSESWAQFDAWINSPAFVEKFLELFGDDLDALGCSVLVEPAAYDRELVEKRDVLTETAGISDRARDAIRGLFGSGKSGKKPAKLFTRLDIERSIGGYFKPPHCDRKNRLCSLIIYFTDLKAEGIEGGELNIYALKEPREASKHVRHPNPADVDVVATLSPEENLGVFFPCSNNSYHGVNALKPQNAARDFLYINISADADTAW
jgi:hypothetical protein